MSPKAKQLIEYNLQDVVGMIAEDESCSPVQAMRKFYGSKVYEGLCDVETGFYLESPAYLYELYKGMKEQAL